MNRHVPGSIYCNQILEFQKDQVYDNLYLSIIEVHYVSIMYE